MFIYEISLIPLNHHVWFITVLVLFGVHQSLGATRRFFFTNGYVSWLVLLYFFLLLDTELLAAFCHWMMQRCRCIACVCACSCQCLHGYKHMIMWVSVSPWLQASDELCDFGGLLAPSPNRHLTVTLPKLKCRFLEQQNSGLASISWVNISFTFGTVWAAIFLSFSKPFSIHNDPFPLWFRYQAHYSLLLFPKVLQYVYYFHFN